MGEWGDGGREEERKGGGEGDPCEVEEKGGEGGGGGGVKEKRPWEKICICLGKSADGYWSDNEAYISITRGIIVLPVFMVSKRCSDPDTGAYERPAAVNARYLEHMNTQSGFVLHFTMLVSLWPSEKTCKRTEEFT